MTPAEADEQIRLRELVVRQGLTIQTYRATLLQVQAALAVIVRIGRLPEGGECAGNSIHCEQLLSRINALFGRLPDPVPGTTAIPFTQRVRIGGMVVTIPALKELKPKVRDFAEAVADIAFLAGSHHHYSGDSREDIGHYIQWAHEFTEAYRLARTPDSDTYMEDIEAFANAKLEWNGFLHPCNHRVHDDPFSVSGVVLSDATGVSMGESQSDTGTAGD